MLVNGEVESISQEGMEIKSGGTQELLISVIKALSNHVAKKSDPMHYVIVQAPAIAFAVANPPVNSEITKAQSDNLPTNGNGRRFTSVAANPYTGLLHYVYYPTYYMG